MLYCRCAWSGTYSRVTWLCPTLYMKTPPGRPLLVKYTYVPSGLVTTSGALFTSPGMALSFAADVVVAWHSTLSVCASITLMLPVPATRRSAPPT